MVRDHTKLAGRGDDRRGRPGAENDVRQGRLRRTRCATAPARPHGHRTGTARRRQRCSRRCSSWTRCRQRRRSCRSAATRSATSSVPSVSSDALGRLPAIGISCPSADLDRLTQQRRRRLARVDTTVVLRALAICAVVSTHMRLRFVPGGAHILLAVVGFNLARFMMPIESTRERVRAGLRTVGTGGRADRRVGGMLGLVPRGVVRHRHRAAREQLRRPAGPPRRCHWHFWFIEVFVQLILVVTALLAVPSIRRLERRFQYGFPLALFAVHAAVAHGVGVDGRLVQHSLPNAHHRVLLRAGLADSAIRLDAHSGCSPACLCVVSIADFFDYAPREWFIGVCLVALVWFREIPIPRPIVRPVAVVASASMWILISHFTIWPRTDGRHAAPMGLRRDAGGRRPGVARRRPGHRHDLCTGPDRRRPSCSAPWPTDRTRTDRTGTSHDGHRMTSHRSSTHRRPHHRRAPWSTT